MGGSRPRVGDRFGAYELVEPLGAGGTAEVWLARDGTDAGSRMVIKRLHPSLRGDTRCEDVLRAEARLLRALDHPNVVRLIASGDVDGVPFLAMEHVDGWDLRALLVRMSQRRVFELPLDASLAIVVGVCRGLAHAHARLGIVHRDVTRENVLLSFDGDVKLVDFGFAVGPDDPGKARGKPSAMSPEQARGEPLDARSDVFAAGVLLFELSTAKRLFKGATDHETLTMIRERDAPPPSTVRPGYPLELERIVLRALARDRADRHPNAATLEADLVAFAASEGQVLGPAPVARFLGRLR
jgi:serine/threonine-protein kinase